MADADGWDSPEQREATLALARRLKRSMQVTMEHDARVMMEQHIRFFGTIEQGPIAKATWRHRLGLRWHLFRERLALWIAPWLGESG